MQEHSTVLTAVEEVRSVIQADLDRQIEDLRARMTPASVSDAVRKLLRQGEDVGGGINAIRMVKQLLGRPQLADEKAVWAYDRLKPALRTAFDQIPSLYFFEGD